MEIGRRNFVLGSLAAASIVVPAGSVLADHDRRRRGQPPVPYPDIVDTTAASEELADFMRSFFTAKSKHQVNRTMAHFAPDMVTYIDSTLNWDEAGFDILKAVFAQFMPNWPPSGLSYPTRIVGDMKGGALVAFTDTPELFGGELRILGALDFKNGKIFRWVDYWDWRGFSNLFGLAKSPKLATYREGAVGERASPTMQKVASRLMRTFASGNASAAAALFSSDAVYEDMTLRAQLLGRISIERYLARVITRLPYGAGVAKRHTVGWDEGGAVEWNGSAASGVAVGVSAIQLDDEGLVTRMTSVYDGSLMSPSVLHGLVADVIDPDV